MADRYPLIVDSITNTVKEIESGDNINLSGSGIVGLTSVNVGDAEHYVTSSGVGTFSIEKKGVDHAPAISISGFGSVGVATDNSPYVLQIGSFKEYPVIGLNTHVLAELAGDPGNFVPDGKSYNADLHDMFSDVQGAVATGIATVIQPYHLENNLDGAAHGYSGRDGTLRYWNILNGAGSPQHVTGGIVIVDVDKYEGEHRWRGGPKDGGWLKGLTNNSGFGTNYYTTPCGIASRGLFVGVGCSDPLVRLDVEGDIHVRNKCIIFGMPQRGGNSNGFESIWMGDNNNPENPGAFHFVTDGGLRQRGNAHLYGGAFIGGTSSGTKTPSTFPFGVGIGTTAITTNSSGSQWFGGTSNYNGSYRAHINGYLRYTGRPSSTSVTTLGVDANGLVRTSSSSRKYKENIQSYGKGLEDVLRLNPVTFNYINDEEEYNPTLGGLIAEDVHDAGLGEFVVYGNDGTEPESVNYGNMVALMANAIRELKEENDSLRSEITAIKEHLGL